MNKPDWKDAPEWANWLAQDKDGEWCWWNIAPIKTASLWTQGYPEESYFFESVGYLEKILDWQCTLEERPSC